MALTQMQLIQSLGDAMAWFERERRWGTASTELRHLCGRIGELYAAVMTNGQLAGAVNQAGYDVVTRDGERVSVKTTAIKGNAGHIDFNPRSLKHVDRVMIFRVNEEEMEIQALFDGSVASAIALMKPGSGTKHSISLAALSPKRKTPKEGKALRIVEWQSYRISELETGSIEVHENESVVTPAKPALRHIASELGLAIVNGSGNPYNTRQLGTLVVDAIEAKASGRSTGAP